MVAPKLPTLSFTMAMAGKSQRIKEDIDKFQQFYQEPLSADPEHRSAVVGNLLGQAVPYIAGEEVAIAKFIPKAWQKTMPLLSRFTAGVTSDAALTTASFQALPEDQQTAENFVQQMALSLMAEGFGAAMGRFKRTGIDFNEEEAIEIGRRPVEEQAEYIEHLLTQDYKKQMPHLSGLMEGEPEGKFLFYKPTKKAVQPMDIVGKTEDPLITEAKKYKSAEEFVKDGVENEAFINVFHGSKDFTDYNRAVYKDFDLSADPSLREASTGGNRVGLSTSKEYDVAKDFAFGTKGSGCNKISN